MYLGDFQIAGGKIRSINRIVDAAKYNIYECFIRLDDIECVALIQEHISGMTLLGFKERELEKKVMEKVTLNCDKEHKKLMAKRNRWMLFGSIIRSLAVCIIIYAASGIFLNLFGTGSTLQLIQSSVGLILGFAVRKVGNSLQAIYANLIPGQIDGV